MLHFVFAGLGVAALTALALKGSKLPPGQNPFDTFPDGVDGDDPISRDVVQASSGQRYTITAFPCGDGRVYSVAEKKGDVDWLSWFFDPTTERRKLWAGNADHEGDVADMQRDLGVES